MFSGHLKSYLFLLLDEVVYKYQLDQVVDSVDIFYIFTSFLATCSTNIKSGLLKLLTIMVDIFLLGVHGVFLF